MNILIIGLGSIAKKHIAALRELVPDAKVFALRSGKNAGQYEDIENIYSLEDTDVRIDFCIISNPTSKHAETIEKLLDREIPLFIEKPVFGDLNHEDLVRKVKEKGILNYVACNLRFLDCLRFLHDHISANPARRVNEVNVYCGSYLPDWRPGTDYRKCYSAIPELGGGVNIDLIHDIDYVYWIFGNPKESFGFCRNSSSLEIPAIDYANYILVYPEFTASVILNYYRRDYKRTIEVVFEDGTWTADLSKNIITDSKGNIVFRGANAPIETYKAQLEYFLRLLAKQELAENDVEKAYEVLKICMKYERPQ